MLIEPPDNNVERRERVAEWRYLKLAVAAERLEMQAVVDIVKELAPRSSKQSHERLLESDSGNFSSILKKWGNWITSEKIFIRGLTKYELREIDASSAILSGMDEIHPPHMGEELQKILPGSQLVRYEDFLSTEEINIRKKASMFRRRAAYGPILEDLYVKRKRQL